MVSYVLVISIASFDFIDSFIDSLAKRHIFGKPIIGAAKVKLSIVVSLNCAKIKISASSEVRCSNIIF